MNPASSFRSRRAEADCGVYQAADLTFKLWVQRPTWCIFNRPPLLGRMEEFLVSMTMACWKTKRPSNSQSTTVVGREESWINTHRQGGLEGMSTFLPNCKRGTRSQTAQFPPHALPLQGLTGLQHWKLRRKTITRTVQTPDKQVN